MQQIFTYPFDAAYIMKKRRSLKRQLLERTSAFIEKKVAVLGGSTTHDIIEILELFLLNNGIKPIFYESDYNKYWEDAVFGNSELDEFHPEIVYFHTNNRNITEFPLISDNAEQIQRKLDSEYLRYENMWASIKKRFGSVIIQNNFELPYFRLLGNKDATDIHGRINFITSLNMKFNEYAQNNSDFYINDINYLSACYGLEAWSKPQYWYMYKYALEINAIPFLSHNIANIIKSCLGKNKKALILDLDNTLWGGVIGDDGIEGISIGNETSLSEAYSEFQQYIKQQKDIGVVLCVNSKNDFDNAILGLNHPDSNLMPDDFTIIKANWENKSSNIAAISNELNLLPESFVFVDDNPAEREIVNTYSDGIAIPDIGKVGDYIYRIDKNGFFEVTAFSQDDYKRNEMYKANAERARLAEKYQDYSEYLCSLQMIAEINAFDDIYIQRIAQLTNKTNQFNLTTKRFTQSEMQSMMNNPEYITLYGKLQDKYGDNGVVSVIVGKIEGNVLHIDLWLMSCRVLKRDLEYAMMDALSEIAVFSGINEICGYYFKTPKNSMVKDFYGSLGFSKCHEDEDGNSTWTLSLENYQQKNNIIKVVKNYERN